MNAYELADLIGLCGDGGYNQDAANMLRQQANRIAELEDKLSFYEIKDLDSGLKPKPLSDEEISQIAKDELIGWACDEDMLSFARAIEERHGIK